MNFYSGYIMYLKKKPFYEHILDVQKNMPVQVDIVTPERQLFSDEVEMVTVPGSDGRMGIMRGHAPLLSTLDIGEIVLHLGDEAMHLAISGGVMEVSMGPAQYRQ